MNKRIMEGTINLTTLEGALLQQALYRLMKTEPQMGLDNVIDELRADAADAFKDDSLSDEMTTVVALKVNIDKLKEDVKAAEAAAEAEGADDNQPREVQLHSRLEIDGAYLNDVDRVHVKQLADRLMNAVAQSVTRGVYQGEVTEVGKEHEDSALFGAFVNSILGELLRNGLVAHDCSSCEKTADCARPEAEKYRQEQEAAKPVAACDCDCDHAENCTNEDCMGEHANDPAEPADAV